MCDRAIFQQIEFTRIGSFNEKYDRKIYHFTYNCSLSTTKLRRSISCTYNSLTSLWRFPNETRCYFSSDKMSNWKTVHLFHMCWITPCNWNEKKNRTWCSMLNLAKHFYSHTNLPLLEYFFFLHLFCPRIEAIPIWNLLR